MSSTTTGDQQQPQQQASSSCSPNDATQHSQTAAGVASTSATATTSTKPHSQHPISQLPMTTRRKLSHFRAQLKRQASKAARSRLDFIFTNSSPTTGDKNSEANTTNQSPSNLQQHQQQHQQHTHQQHMQHQQNQQQHQRTDHHQQGGGPGPSSGKHLVGQHSLAVPSRHGSHHHHHHSLHSKNFKQKIIALMKKFRTDGSDFDEQYRAALERELLAVGRDSTAIDELLEQGLDVEEEDEGDEGSGSGLDDWDNMSESSAPKPSLRPYFSSTTLDKV